jgi:hypothetical protein
MAKFNLKDEMYSNTKEMNALIHKIYKNLQLNVPPDKESKDYMRVERHSSLNYCRRSKLQWIDAYFNSKHFLSVYMQLERDTKKMYTEGCMFL